MNAATRDRLVKEGRTHWFSIRIAIEGRRFPLVLHRWARNADDARDRAIGSLSKDETILTITEEHR